MRFWKARPSGRLTRAAPSFRLALLLRTNAARGLAGDLFRANLLSGIHFDLWGQMRRRKRAQIEAAGLFPLGRTDATFPDLIETLYDYPNFRVVLRCKFEQCRR